MADERGGGNGNGEGRDGDDMVSAAMLDHMGSLEKNLQTIADDLRLLGEQAVGRVQEIENLATHVLAIEAVLAAMLKTYPVGADAVDAEVRRGTADLADDPDGSPKVRAVARGLLRQPAPAASQPNPTVQEKDQVP